MNIIDALSKKQCIFIIFYNRLINLDLKVLAKAQNYFNV